MGEGKVKELGRKEDEGEREGNERWIGLKSLDTSFPALVRMILDPPG
jgi:hypothetical protein